MLTVLRRRNYGLLWFAQLISMIGNWALFAALPFFVYQITGSVLATGGMFMIQIIPPLLFGSFAGVFVDRWDHRWTMIGSTLFRGLVLLIMLGVRSADLVWLVYLAGFLESAATQFFGPANNALLPTLVDEDQLLTANSLDALGENSARLIGPALGGVMLAWQGIQGVILFDIGSYLGASLLMYFISIPPSEPDLSPSDEISTISPLSIFWGELRAGIKLVLNNKPLSRIFLVLGIALLGDSILTVLLVAFYQDVVGVGPTEFGLVLTVTRSCRHSGWAGDECSWGQIQTQSFDTLRFSHYRHRSGCHGFLAHLRGLSLDYDPFKCADHDLADQQPNLDPNPCPGRLQGTGIWRPGNLQRSADVIRYGVCKRIGRNPGNIQYTLCGRGDLHPVRDPGSSSPAGY